VTQTVRVLILTPDFPPSPGGIQLLVYRLATNFEAVESRIVALGVEGAAAFDGESDLDVRRVARKGARRNRLAVARLNLAGIRAGIAFRPDVVLSGHVVTAPAATLLRAAGRGRTVQYLHGDEFRTRPGLVRRAMARADAVVAVSRHTHDMAVEAGCAPDRVHIIPPGVDLPGETVAERSDRPTVVTVARLVESYKGHDVMIRAMRLVRERVPEARWVVVGDGPLRPELEDLARHEAVGDAIGFVGAASNRERDEWYDRAHVFAMPSRLPEAGVGGEGFGIVYLEAGAHGLPSVGGNVAGARDAVVDGETGILVDPTDPTALAAALSGLLLDRDRAATMGAAARRHAESHAWPRIAAQVEGLFRDLTPASGA
jgi:phosphatidylinositol alpha-1,6-mannosyltransferase